MYEFSNHVKSPERAIFPVLLASDMFGVSSKACELDFKSRNGSHTCIQILKVPTAPWAKVNEPGLENTMLRILMKDCTENSYFIGMKAHDFTRECKAKRT